MVDPAPHGGAPGVRAKELQSIHLLKHRQGTARLDIAPFLALYLAVIVKALYHASKFEWNLFSWHCYGVGGCALLHILTILFVQWNINFRAFVSCSKARSLSDAEAVKAVPFKFLGKTELVPLEKRTYREGLSEVEELTFEFRKQRYVYNPQDNVFEKLMFPVKEPFDYYFKATGHGAEAKALAAFDKYGLNKFDVPVPPFGELLKEHMLAPFFCFQVFCVALWCMDEYWYYSMFTLFMLVTFECTVVQQRLRNLRELRSLQTPKQHIQVYRCGKWELLPGEALLPGDIISIGRPSGGGSDEKVVPADCLLLAGSCIVEEAVLTGESTPQWKMACADEDPHSHLHIKMHKAHVLFGGTKVLQHTGDKNARIRTPDGGCLAIVLRTGFETAQGRLMRTILFSTERVTANNWETGLFILFLLIFAVSAAYYVLDHGLKDPTRDRFKLVLNCIMIITSVIPPELPMELSIAVNASLVALARKRVFCTEPFRIPFAGKVEVCCFDKTGTLTSDHLLLEDVVGEEGSLCVREAKADGKDKDKDKEGEAGGSGAVVPRLTAGKAKGAKAEKAAGKKAEVVEDGPGRVLAVQGVAPLVMAACHSLIQVGEDIVGDPLEKAALEASNWVYANDTALSPDRSVRATILHRHHFNSNLKRMSCVVRVEDDAQCEPQHQVVVKGAPEVIKQFLAHVPATYDSQYKAYAAQGARVIALAHKRLPPAMDAGALRGMSREEAESELEWAGFAVFSCPLKPESEPALAALASSSHMLMMITGDAPLTACFAASKVHIVTREVLVLSHRDEEKGHSHGADKARVRLQDDASYMWVSPDERTVLPFSRQRADIVEVAAQYDLALSGDALAYIEGIGLAPLLIPLCQVFARVSPEQKELVLVTLRAQGRVTLMCGDGTNDVGGLKAAHVGVALLSSTEYAEKLKALKAKKAKEGGDKDKAKAVAVPEEKKKKTASEEMIEKIRASGKPVPPHLEKLAKMMDSLEAQGGMDGGELPMLKPGDASMASPFTAKAAGVMPCTDIIKQGRCTLVTTVQMFKILGLLCLSTAYSLSVMYLEGVKLGDVQATVTGMLTAAMFFFISHAKPLDQLSKERPHPNIFNLYFFGSLLGQFAVHLALLMYMYRLALQEMPATERLGSDSEFKPNLVNTVCYVVEAVVQIMTFTCNYVGHPFNTSIEQNKGMAVCIRWMLIFLGVVVFDFVPGLSASFGLVPIPNHIRYQLVVLVAGAFGFCYAWEQALRKLFPAPMPPAKGYMVHMPEIQAAAAGAKKAN